MQINVSKIIHSNDIMANLPFSLKSYVISVLDEGLRNCRLIVSDSFHINQHTDTQLNQFLSKYATYLELKPENLKYAFYPERVIGKNKYNILTIYCILT